MVDNYLPTFDMRKEIEKHLEAITSDIAGSKKGMLKESILDKTAFNYMLRREGKPFNKHRLKVHVIGEGIDHYISLEDSCTGCGVCASVCPVENR